jgi:hypothetical protein
MTPTVILMAIRVNMNRTFRAFLTRGRLHSIVCPTPAKVLVSRLTGNLGTGTSLPPHRGRQTAQIQRQAHPFGRVRSTFTPSAQPWLAPSNPFTGKLGSASLPASPIAARVLCRRHALLSHAVFRCIIPPNSTLGGEPWALRKLQIFGSRFVAGA